MAATLGRDQYVYMAKLAEQAERYEEMVQFMEQLATVEDRVVDRAEGRTRSTRRGALLGLLGDPQAHR
ncbi:hypothetical protein F2Q70_00006360 [Brassica cretica]|uniref:14-3-3 domain-containing protein n=1 Tax=Brassica cretica TaxID=69181 RepID=A0A8S9IWK4_BRACR|nr:hypothetical protein F2Q70_00006360 [Brassica cretica]